MLPSLTRSFRGNEYDLQDLYDGPGRDRTCDLGIKSPLLYRLSYRPRALILTGWGKGTPKDQQAKSARLPSSAATILVPASIPAALRCTARPRTIRSGTS